MTVAVSAAVFVPCLALAQVVQPIARAPFPSNPAATAISNARAALATSGANAAASRAQYAYRASLAQYARGDRAGARASAVQAMTLLAEPDLAPFGTSIAPLAPLEAPGANAPLGDPARSGIRNGALGTGLLGSGSAGSAIQVDEDELVARSRSAVASCAARKPDELDLAKKGFDAVWAAHAANDVVRERLAARALIVRCGVLF